jgi:hypothetical protein
MIRGLAAFLLFAFLAAMAGTGVLVGIGSAKVQAFAWLVETLFVGSLGRSGAVAAFLVLGLGAGTIAFRWRKQER